MTEKAPMFCIVLPGGKVARVPAEVLQQYVVEGLTPAHGSGEDDVEGHHLTTDGKSGSSFFHHDWEMGECDVTTNQGPRRSSGWHRHPYGTEYAEMAT